MKTFLFSLICLFAADSVCGKNVKDVVVPDFGRLRDVLTDNDLKTLDSIHVTGAKLKAEDFYLLGRMCENGRLTGIDLSQVEAVADSIPERAFMSKGINGMPANNAEEAPFTVNLHYIRLPKNIRKIGSMAFFGTNIVEMELPKTVDYIGYNGFGDCRELQRFTVANPSPSSIYAKYAFEKVHPDAVLVVPEGSASSYSSSAGWSSFSSVMERPGLYTTLHVELSGKSLDELYGSALLEADSLVVTGKLAQSDFPALRKAVNYGHLTGINLSGCTVEGNILPEGAFGYDSYKPERKNCTDLLYVSLPEGLTSIGKKAFFWDKNLRSINIPSTVTAIGEMAFYKCIRLGGTLTIPEGVKVLQPETFEECRLISEINLPSTLEEMGDLSLYLYQAEWLWRLSKVRMNRKTPPVMLPGSERYAFGYDAPLERVSLANCILYVPMGTKSIYEAADMWRDFGTIVETPELDGGTTGIAQTVADPQQTEPSCIYTLDGRYVGNDIRQLGKGVYVVGGKKIVK